MRPQDKIEYWKDAPKNYRLTYATGVTIVVVAKTFDGANARGQEIKSAVEELGYLKAIELL